MLFARAPVALIIDGCPKQGSMEDIMPELEAAQHMAHVFDVVSPTHSEKKAPNVEQKRASAVAVEKKRASAAAVESTR